MNILIIVSTLGYGGNEQSARLIGRCLSDAHRVDIAAFESRGGALAPNEIDLNLPASRSCLKKILNAVRRICKLKAIIKKNKVSLILCMTNEYNPVSLHRFKGVKKIVSCRDCGNLMRNAAQFYRMNATADHLIFNSRYMRDYYLAQYPTEAGRVSALYNVVDAEKVRAAAEDPIPEADFFERRRVMIAVGRFCKEKGYNHLIRIFEKAREQIASLGLVIIGDGELFAPVRQMADESPYRDDILLLGRQENPYKYIARSQIFALTSVSEGFPNVLLEALALGVPIVSANCASGPCEILDDDVTLYQKNRETVIGKYGILAPALHESPLYDGTFAPDHADLAFAEAVTLLCRDTALRDTFKSRSPRRAEDFDKERFARAFEAVALKLTDPAEEPTT